MKSLERKVKRIQKHFPTKEIISKEIDAGIVFHFIEKTMIVLELKFLISSKQKGEKISRQNAICFIALYVL